MTLAGGFHLSYCSNIHPGETWDEVSAALAAALPCIRRSLGASGPFAIGLRLSARAAETLAQPAALTAFRQFLRDGDYYVPTINGFPYGAFHGERVKERVYLPDWRSEERLRYSNRLSTILAALLADHPQIEGSVSTVPGAFKAAASSPSDCAAIAHGLLLHATHLVTLRRQTGIAVTLAIEPEPACLIETTAEAVAFFERFLFDPAAVQAAKQATGVELDVDDVRRHVGVCVDACHLAVEYEEPDDALRRLSEAGIRICKVQVSSAIRARGAGVGSAARQALGRFADDTYLHQVVERRGDRFTHYTDLPDALDAADPCPSADDHEWRVHFHVPVFLDAMQGLETTQSSLIALLEALRRSPIRPCLEVETYTWDVLPPEYRTVDLCTAIARELEWVRQRIEPSSARGAGRSEPELR